ncbi:MAG: prenyltransferase/squalene oxidase repeat-containing protein [Planctomycetaceae bacterium]
MPAYYGPWTTSLAAGSQLELSAFWRRRMARLPAVCRQASPGRPQRAALVMLALAVSTLPMIHAEPQRELASDSRIAPGPVRAEAVGDAMAPGAAAGELGAAQQLPATDEVAAAVELAAADQPPIDPFASDLARAVRDATAYLSSRQKDDGSWRLESNSESFPTGVSSACALALSRSGVRSDDLRLRRAAEFLGRQQSTMTYEIALQTVALSAIDQARYRERIERNATRLEQTQIVVGENSGSWSYGPGRGAIGLNGDRSNAEFALWGLDAAARAGAKIDRATWERALAHWLAGQNPDGGWSYTGRGAGSTGSMTASGVASIAACLSHLRDDENPPAAAEMQALKEGLGWLSENFSVRQNPGGRMWLLYYALMLRRACDATATKTLGDHDWHRELAEYMVNCQDRVTGAWRGVGQMESDPVLGTALVILALTRPGDSK